MFTVEPGKLSPLRVLAEGVHFHARCRTHVEAIGNVEMRICFAVD